MYPQYHNIYQAGRKHTRLTQEAAAERLGLSVESLKLYEGGRRVPSDETVAGMCELYGTPWLALEHAKATDVLGMIPEGVEVRPLAQAVLTFAGRVRSVCGRLTRLMSIAEDGRVDAEEADDFADVKALIAANVAAELALLYATEDGKKERPGTALPKRSASQRNAETNCKSILPQSRSNVNTCHREEVRA